jgi:arginyl-tRNA synthetase
MANFINKCNIYVIMPFKKEIVKLIAKHTEVAHDAIEELLEVPPDLSLGDYAFPCFFLGKEKNKQPGKIAKELADQIKPTKLVHKIQAKGPYLNFFIDKAAFARHVLAETPEIEKKSGSIMVEFSSPNTNKPQHLGHIRNNLLGSVISSLLQKVGYKVIKANLINDRGIHICKSMLAYQKWGNNKEPDKKPDHFVGDFYVLFSQNAQKNPELEKEAQEMLVKWEQGDKQTVELWKKMRKWCIQGFEETYRKLGIDFDKVYFESEIYREGNMIVAENLQKGVFEKEKGAVIARLEPDLPNKVLIRQDGTSLYITQDIGLAVKKFNDFKLDKSIYVVGSEQNLYFKQLFAILEMLGYHGVEKCIHLSYGMVYLPEGKMKSREGTVVDADNLIENVKELSRLELRKRYPELPDEEIEKRAGQIGLAALKFMILKYDPKKDINYNPEESISFEGETGPYLQYSHARICSILRKNQSDVSKNIDFSLFSEKIELNLINMLFMFTSIIEDAAEQYKPSLVARYLLDLSQLFNEFYHSCPVLQATENIRQARLLLIQKTRDVIKEGLSLLGVAAPEVM